MPTLAAAVLGALSACGVLPGGEPTAGQARAAGAAERQEVHAGEAAAGPLPRRPPGLGPRTLAEIPREAGQVVLVRGEGPDSSDSSVVLYERTAAGWRAGASWPAHNALRGWTADHHEGDLRSPMGVFTLSDAGGRLPDPGSKLPYHRSDAFTADGTGFEGEPLAGAFDYVVAIDYNRSPGVSPLDATRPLGVDRGGGIWLHVDHGGPTHGCVTLAEEHMRLLLRRLDPARHPVIVMGDAASLSR
ncbi:L,D-transpeptidase family protein [Streptomyces hoynatensis]|uniref:L,D-TPase catalytic domain-containing protein n=1 Tax=Streptomyces hoynatensis TaxID=1141874 RepID=A0A3A9Z2I9_9ACTN|nr:L,D-transpeptidase family protein [Streptomyces hoynatensis]RKN41636.1 hypothetical protein D7294_14175 [Streptomyces hoynatensis]